MITTTLEQSQKLKELGAPQDTYFVWCEDVTTFSKGKYKKPYLLKRGSDYAKLGITVSSRYTVAYTLSELIDWLGDDFHQLVKYNSFWFAHRTRSYSRDDLPEGAGTTPIEAVYNLTIATKGNVL